MCEKELLTLLLKMSNAAKELLPKHQHRIELYALDLCKM